MAARERKTACRPKGAWLVVLEDSSIWVADGQEGGADRLTLERVELAELRRRFPRLAQALAASNWKDCPRIVREPPR
jgi:hypothetical protein